jgi:D-beta-D-heptose 7-phosphate kinase/D-beta-D-heptose 1-phosphate adenosyltransferase
MKNLLKQFSSSGVIIIGDIMVDRFIWGNVDRISPEAPVPVVEVSQENMLLGGAANVANNV